MSRTQNRSDKRKLDKALKKDLGRKNYNDIVSNATRALVAEEVNKVIDDNEKYYWQVVQANLIKSMREFRVSKERAMKILKRTNQLNKEQGYKGEE